MPSIIIFDRLSDSKYPIPPVISTESPAEMTFEFLTEERARELIGEQFRWLDLKRWGILGQ